MASVGQASMQVCNCRSVFDEFGDQYASSRSSKSSPIKTPSRISVVIRLCVCQSTRGRRELPRPVHHRWIQRNFPLGSGTSTESQASSARSFAADTSWYRRPGVARNFRWRVRVIDPPVTGCGYHLMIFIVASRSVVVERDYNDRASGEKDLRGWCAVRGRDPSSASAVVTPQAIRPIARVLSQRLGGTIPTFSKRVTLLLLFGVRDRRVRVAPHSRDKV